MPANPRSFSQLAAPFFASGSLGIPHAPFPTSVVTLAPPVSRGAFSFCLLVGKRSRARLLCFLEERQRPSACPSGQALVGPGGRNPPSGRPAAALTPAGDPRAFPRGGCSVQAYSEGVLAPPVLQKGGVPAAPSGTATLLRLSPSHRLYPRPLLPVADFRSLQLPWLDGRCVQGPGTYSPRRG